MQFMYVLHKSLDIESQKIHRFAVRYFNVATFHSIMKYKTNSQPAIIMKYREFLNKKTKKIPGILCPCADILFNLYSVFSIHCASVG